MQLKQQLEEIYSYPISITKKSKKDFNPNNIHLKTLGKEEQINSKKVEKE